MTDGTEILKNINASLKSKKLYPQGHPAAVAPLKKSYEMLTETMKGRNNLAIGMVNEALVFEETPVKDYEKLYPEIILHMADKNVDTIIFEKGLTERELSSVVNILCDDENISGSALQKRLHSEGVTHITLKSIFTGKKNMVEVYKGAVEVVKNVMGEVRMGKIPKSGPIDGIVDDMTECIFSDNNAMLGLTMIKNYDNYLYNHSVNVSVLSLSLGRAMGLEAHELHAIGVASLLHDIGKTGVSEDIIRKPGGLSSEEWEKVKEHPLLGSKIIKRMDGIIELVGRLIYEHHIKYDHSGYPETTSTLHPYSQIITISDAYDALTTLRVYQKPHNPAEAIKVMNNFSGRHFNPEILKTFISLIGVYPVGTMVRLSTSEICLVTKTNPDAAESPVVKVLYGKDGYLVDEPYDVDLASAEEKERKIIAVVNPTTTDLNIEAFFEKTANEASAA